MKFNENLKYLRKQYGLTQEQLAEQLNVSRQAITKWESGQSLPDIENLKEISYIFSVSIDSLIGDIETKSTSKINKKIDDIGYFIFGLIMIIGFVIISISNFINQITHNEDIVIMSSILMSIMGFIIFILLIKLYLKDTKDVIINMKPTTDGKVERKKYIIKNSILQLIGLSIFIILLNLNIVSRGIIAFVKTIFVDIIILLIIVSIFGVAKYIKIEKKVKELNND